MKVERSRVILFLLVFDMSAQVVGQFCSEFTSPMLIQTSTSRDGTIQIPTSGIGGYASNQVCEWTIDTGTVGYGVQLDVVSCSLEGKDIFGDCNSDYVEVYDLKDSGRIPIGRFCGDEVESYKTTGTKMYLRFQSNQAFQFNGFRALYMPVPLNFDQGNDKQELILRLAVGIPVAVLVTVVLVVLVIYLVRRHRQKTATVRTNLLASAISENNNNCNLPGGNPSLDSPHRCDNPHICDSGDGPHRCNIHHTFCRHAMRPPYLEDNSRNVPLQVAVPPSFQEDSRNMRSVTPPPAYETLDFVVDIGQDRVPTAPPSYEMVVKYNIDSTV